MKLYLRFALSGITDNAFFSVCYNTKNCNVEELTMQDRLPPQNIEAEQSVLSAMLIDNTAVGLITEMLLPEDCPLLGSYSDIKHKVVR